MSDYLAPVLSWKTALVVALTPIAWRLLKPSKNNNAKGMANVPGPNGGSFLQGHFTVLFSNDSWVYHRQLAQKFGRVSRACSVKQCSTFLIRKQCTTSSSNNNHILFGPGLFAMKGEQHRKQRKMLNPVFSVAHLRHMVPTFFKVSEQLSDTFSQKVGNQKQEMDMVTWMTRAALEIVGQSGMGTSFGPVTEEQEEPHYIASVKEFQPLMTLTLLP